MVEIRINKEYCKGCGYCIAFCPLKVFEWSPDINTKGIHLPTPKHIERCTACHLCEYYCPDLALVVEE